MFIIILKEMEKGKQRELNLKINSKMKWKIYRERYKKMKSSQMSHKTIDTGREERSRPLLAHCYHIKGHTSPPLLPLHTSNQYT